MAFYTLGAIISGILVGKTRLLQPIEFGSGLIAVLGAALIYCIDIGTPKAWWIGAQVPFGLGIGLGNQVPVTALQGFATPETVAATMGVAFSEIPLDFVGCSDVCFANACCVVLCSVPIHKRRVLRLSRELALQQHHATETIRDSSPPQPVADSIHGRNGAEECLPRGRAGADSAGLYGWDQRCFCVCVGGDGC